MTFSFGFLCTAMTRLLLILASLIMSGDGILAESDLERETPDRFRVVIVGGGMAGCAAAWSLKQSHGNYECLLLSNINKFNPKPFIGKGKDMF